MTSKQVMLAFLVLALAGCVARRVAPVEPLASPYETRQIWAVAPLRNESGSLYADGVKMADHLAYQLENAEQLDVLPVNRTLRAMNALGMRQVNTRQDAMRLLQTLGADALVVGNITAYNPYDPPRLGIALELYQHPRAWRSEGGIDPRKLSRAATDELSMKPSKPVDLPVVAVSEIYDAASPGTREGLQRYAHERGIVKSPEAAVHYRINIDLYSEFVSYAMCARLLQAEKDRIATLAQVEPTP